MSEEIRVPMNMFSVRRVCACGGDMRFIDMSNAAPLLLRHKCAGCGREENFSRIYPVTIHEEAPVTFFHENK